MTTRSLSRLEPSVRCRATDDHHKVDVKDVVEPQEACYVH